MKETENRQVPWESSSLTGEFCFTKEEVGNTVISVPTPTTPLWYRSEGEFPNLKFFCNSCNKQFFFVVDPFDENRNSKCPHCGYAGGQAPKVIGD